MKNLINTFFVIGLVIAPVFADAAKPRAVDDDVENLLYLGQDRLIVFKLHLRVDGKSYRQVYDEQLDKYFKELDANKDGVLTKNELNAVPTPTDARRTLPSPTPGTRLPTVSKNLIDSSPRDGKVTRKELRIYLKRIGYAPFSLQIQSGNANSQMAYVYGMQGRQNDAGKRLFALLDRNDDGKLSIAELKAAGKSLRKTDFDDDGTISSAELGPVQSPYAFAVSGRRATGQPNKTEFLSLTSSGSPSPTMVRKLIQRYDKSQSANGKTRSGADGKLSRRELRIGEAVFSKFDRDGDGRLDYAELRYFLRNPPANVEMILRLGTLKSGEKRIELVRVDKEMKSIVKRVTDKLANLRLTASQLDIGPGGGSRGAWSVNNYDRQFDAADTDNNGYLTNEEARRNGLFSQNFKQMDADNDGKVFKKELHAFIRRQTSLAQSRTILSINDQGRDLFKILDLNRDQRLSRQELVAAIDRIAAWDNDGDNQIAKSEIPRQYRLSVDRGTPGGNLGVRFVTTSYTMNRQVRRVNVGPKWFQRMDLNGDGEVAKREFLGTPKLFAKIDTNRDAHISVAEAQAIEAKRPKGAKRQTPATAPKPVARKRR